MGKVILEKIDSITKITLHDKFYMVLMLIMGGILLIITFIFAFFIGLKNTFTFTTILSYVILILLLTSLGMLVSAVFLGKSESVLIDKHTVEYNSTFGKKILARKNIKDIWVESVKKVRLGPVFEEQGVTSTHTAYFLKIKTKQGIETWMKKSIGDYPLKLEFARLLRNKLDMKSPLKFKDLRTRV